jgi:hypothetical protein
MQRWPGLARYCWAAAAVLLFPPGFTREAPGELTPDVVAERLQQRFDRMQDYVCLIQSETRAATRVEAMTFRLWFRKPRLLRLRVLHGRREGSELIVDTSGVLRGRRGGILRPFSRRLDRSDPSLRSLRGQPAWELDFGSFLLAMRARMALSGSVSTVSRATGSDPHLYLEVRYRPSPSDHPLRDVWGIDPREWLLTSGDVFDGEVRVDHIEISEIHVDTGIKESWFHF